MDYRGGKGMTKKNGKGKKNFRYSKDSEFSTWLLSQYKERIITNNTTVISISIYSITFLY